MLQKLESLVLELYQEVDRAVTAYREVTGLQCPAGCLQCCFSEKVETTVLEMLPVAFHLFRTSQAELIMKRIEKAYISQQCILFRPDLQPTEGGGCSQYPYRALVCRLFGFAGNIDREGIPQLAKCRHMPHRESIPGKGKNDPHQHAVMPLFHGFGIALTAIHPDLGAVRKPINEALFEALAKVGLLLDLQTIPQDISERIDLPPDSPATPTPSPRKKAA